MHLPTFEQHWNILPLMCGSFAIDTEFLVTCIGVNAAGDAVPGNIWSAGDEMSYNRRSSSNCLQK